jgi:hypothetical protein
MMIVGVRAAGDSMEFTTPQALFDSGYVNIVHPTNFLAYDMSADGQRFLIPQPVGSAISTSEAPITVVLNWTAMLKRE